MSRILVVDDDSYIVRTLEIMLRDDGHEVVTATRGEQALECLKRQSVDIALVDLQLPGISGTDVLRQLRDAHRDVEAVIITADGSIETAVEAMKEGAFDYLTKPFSPDQVRHRLQQIETVKRLRSEVAGLQRRVGDLPFLADFITHALAQTQEIRSLVTAFAHSEGKGNPRATIPRSAPLVSRRLQDAIRLADCRKPDFSMLVRALRNTTGTS